MLGRSDMAQAVLEGERRLQPITMRRRKTIAIDRAYDLYVPGYWMEGSGGVSRRRMSACEQRMPTRRHRVTTYGRTADMYARQLSKAVATGRGSVQDDQE